MKITWSSVVLTFKGKEEFELQKEVTIHSTKGKEIVLAFVIAYGVITQTHICLLPFVISFCQALINGGITFVSAFIKNMQTDETP